MKVSLNWVREFTEVDLPTDELLTLATERLGGVEGYTDLGKHYEGIVVAKVVSCEKHPNADKLNVCKIDDDQVVADVARDDDGYVQVVCGAPNVREGLLVAWIPPSAVVPVSYGEKELFVLEARDLRGQLSNGMLASPRELGLNDDHDGILEIEGDAAIGTPFSQLYDLSDILIDFENKMFTHRPDCFGQLGVAREIAGIQHKSFTSPEWYLGSVTSSKAEKSDKISQQARDDKMLSVTIEDSKLCPRYMAIVLDNVTIKPSPLWLQSYLKRVGIRPINNVVDVTNYIMMLTAQPLHAFDFDKVAKDGKAEIIVRRPQEDEQMTLLDGKAIVPHKDATLICNPDGPIALGGVMGGGNSEIDEKTTKIVLECATFDMYNIRKTSMAHGIFTDAVTRFNKGQPSAQLPAVLAQAVEMFTELTGAQVSSDVVDSNPGTYEPATLTVPVEVINSRLGKQFDTAEIIALLNNVELQATHSGDHIEITVPFWRTDIEIVEDVIEEVGRLYGFNNLPTSLPERSIAPVTPNPLLVMKQQVRTILARAGANEVLTYSFVHGNLLSKVGQDPKNSYAIRNALSPDLQYYRQSLTPSLLELIHPNIKSGFDEFAIFEVNKAHNKVHGDGEDGLPGELNIVALSFASKSQTTPAYYNARRYLDYMAENLGLTLEYAPAAEDTDFPVTAAFDLSRSAFVTIAEADIFLGIIGEYRQPVQTALKLPVGAAGFEIGLSALLQASQSLNTPYQPLSKYPSSSQDVTLQVSVDTGFAELEQVLKDVLADTKYQWSIEPLNIFAPNEISKNISFRVTLSSLDHTLTTQEVNDIIAQLVQQASNATKAKQV